MQREVIGKAYDMSAYEPYLRAAALRREERAGRVGRQSTKKTKEKSYVEARMRLENTPIEYLQVLDTLVRGADFDRHINLEEAGKADTVEERAEYFDAIIEDRDSWRLRNPLFDTKSALQYADDQVGLTLPDEPKKSESLRLNPLSRVVLNRSIGRDYDRGSRNARMAREEKSTRLLEARIRAARSSNDMTRLITELVDEGRDTRAIARLNEQLENSERKIVGLRLKEQGGIELTKQERKQLEKHEAAFTGLRVELNLRTAEMAQSLDERMAELQKKTDRQVYTLEDFAARRDALQELDFLQQKRAEVMDMRKTSYEIYREEAGDRWIDPTARYAVVRERVEEPEKEAETLEKESEKEIEMATEKKPETETVKETEVAQKEQDTVPVVAVPPIPDETYHRPIPPEKLHSAKNYAPARQRPGAQRQKTAVLGEHGKAPVSREKQEPAG